MGLLSFLFYRLGRSNKCASFGMRTGLLRTAAKSSNVCHAVLTRFMSHHSQLVKCRLHKLRGVKTLQSKGLSRS